VGDIITQAQSSRISRLNISEGVMDMNDAVYGSFRQFSDIQLEVSPRVDGKAVVGKFSARFAGQTMHGDVSRTMADDGTVKLSSNVSNIDFASFLPFIDDPDSVTGVIGTGALSIDVAFDGKTGKVTGGVFHVDLTGMDMRVQD